MTFQDNAIIINSRGKTGRRLRLLAILDRAVWRARQEIMAQEDDAVFKALDAAAAAIITIETSEDSGNKDI